MGNTRRTSVLIATTCALVASPVMGPASAAPTPLRTGHFAHVRVHDAHGRPVPGATVVLLQEPAAATLANLRVGDSYSAVAVASGTTAPDGSTDLSEPEVTNGDGSPVNFRVVATDGLGSATTFTTPGGRDSALSLQFGSASSASSTPSSGNAASAVSKGTTTSTLLSSYSVWDIVGQLYSTTTGVTGDFTYNAGQTSELGVGVSATGAYGSFSVGGTSAQSSGISINYPTLSATFQQYLKTQWLYGKFKDVYTTCVKGFCTSTTSYGARPYKFIGGSLLNTASSVPSATHCAYYISGSGATVSTGSAITWTNGVSIGSVIGIDLSSKTGYAVNAELKYTFTANRHLCGTGDYPNGANSYQIVAEA